MILYNDHPPDAENYNRLRLSVGWGVLPPDVTAAALPKSLYGVTALDGDLIIGCARVVGDGGLCYYIQDVIVMPEYQRQGIGKGLMARVMDYLTKHAPLNAYVGLMAARGREDFYKPYGFIERPNEQFGAGMIQFWGRLGEQSEC